jgi:hypothetical protein
LRKVKIVEYRISNKSSFVSPLAGKGRNISSYSPQKLPEGGGIGNIAI